MKVPSNLIKDIRRYYSQQLEPLYGADESNAMILILLQHFFSIDRMMTVMEPDLRLNESELLTFHFAIKELLKQKPIQYIIGETWFCDMRFRVDESVLIPRPETEEMTKLIMKDFRSEEELNILDIGTGSGCIAVSLAKAFQKSIVTAIDISEKALNTAHNNAIDNQTDVKFVNCDIFNIGEEINSEKYDLIVSNPPYVRESEKSEMRANVLDYEPSKALFVSDDNPLAYYNVILNFAKGHIKEKGKIWFEINENLGEEMIELSKSHGFENVILMNDFRDKARFCIIRKDF